MSDRSQYIIGIFLSFMIAVAYLYFTEARESAELDTGTSPVAPAALAVAVAVESASSEQVRPDSSAVSSPEDRPGISDVADFKSLEGEPPEDAPETPVSQSGTGGLETQNAEPPLGSD